MTKACTRMSVLLFSLVPLAAWAAAARAQEPQDEDPAAWEIPDEASARPNPLAPNAEALRAGRTLWETHCLNCHGPLGRGDGPDARLHERRKGHAPRNLTDPHVQKNLTDGDIFYRLSHGIVEKAKGGEKVIMPAFGEKTSDAERWSLVIYVRELGKSPAASASSPRSGERVH